MTELGISLGISPRETFDHFISLLQRAEELGVDAAWVIDSQMAMKDAYAALAVGARETQSIKLGPGVTNLVTRHETVIANAMNTLADFAPDRIMLGLGAGDSSVQPLGLRPLAIKECEDGMGRLRQLMAGEDVSAGGNTAAVHLSFAPPSPPPIFFAGSQPRMLNLAGAVADGVILMGPADPETISMQLEHVERGSLDRGREPNSVFRDVWVTMAVGDEKTALQDVKSWCSAQARWLTTWKTLPDSLIPFQEEMQAAADQYDFSTHLARVTDHANTISDEFAKLLAIAGSPKECAERLQGIIDVGVDRLTITLLSGGRASRLEAIGEVWSQLKTDKRLTTTPTSPRAGGPVE